MKMNVIMVYDENEENLLTCIRTKDPYKGLYSLVGGKIEENEDGLASAYRELFEETGISNTDISLKHLMTFYYAISDAELQVYVGKLTKEVTLVEEVNELLWIDVNSDFYNQQMFSGEGNIAHMLEQVKIHYNNIFTDKD
jgi:ADP-ribose pyrophosphatase